METKHAINKVLLRSAVAAALACAAMNSQAGTDTSSLPVSASVADNCVIDASGGLDFGPYDPVTANAVADLDGAGNISVTCTSGATVDITLGQGDNADTGSTAGAPLRRLNDGGTNFLDYNLYTSGARTTVWEDVTGVGYTGVGTAELVPVFGRIPAGQNVPSGSYADTVLATVTF